MLKLKNCVQLAVAAMILAGTTKILCATTFANTPYIINKNGLATVPYGTEPYLLHTEGATEEPLAAPNLRFISKAIIDYPNGITQGIVQDSNNKVYAVILDTWIILPLTLPNGPTQTICSFAKPKKPYTLNQKAKNIISLITYFNPTKPSNVLQFFAVDDGLNMYSIANPIKSTNYTLTPLATTWSNWSSSAGLSQSQITLYTNTLQSLLPKTYYKLNLPASFTPTTIQNKAVIMATLIDRNNSTINLVLDANGNLYSSNNNLLTDLTLPGVALTQPTLTNLLQASDTYGPCFANNDASLTNFNSMVANYNNLLQKQALSWRIAVTTPSGQPTANVVAMVTLTDRDETSTSYLVDTKGNMLDAAGKTLTQNYTDWLNGQQAILDAKYGNAQRFVGDNNANGLATATSNIQSLIAAAALAQKQALSWRIAVTTPSGQPTANVVAMVTLTDRDETSTSYLVDIKGNMLDAAGKTLTQNYTDWLNGQQAILDAKYGNAQRFVGDNNANGLATATSNIQSLIAAAALAQKQALSWRITVTTPSGQPTANVVAMVTLTDRDETSTSYLVDIKGNMLDAAGKTLTQNYTDWLNGQQAILDAKYGNAQRFVGDNNANGLATASTQIAKAIATYANNYVYSLSPMMPNNLTSAPILINSKLNPLLITGLSLNDRKNQTLISNLAIDTQGLLYSFNNNNYLPLATTALGTNLKVKAKNSAQLKLSELLTMTDQSGTCFASDDTTEKNFKALQTQYIQQQQSFWSISVTANNDVELSINNGIPLKSVAQIEVTGRMGQTYQLPTANGFIFPGIYLIDISGQVYYKNGTNFTPFSTIQSTSTNPQTSYITWLNNQLAKQNDPGYGGVACFANKANNPAIKTAVAQAQSLVNAARLKTNWTLTLNPPAISLASGIVAAFNLVNRGADNLIGTGYTPGTYFVGVSGMMHTSAGAMNVNYSTWLTNLAKQQTSFPDAPNVKLPAFASSLNDAFVNLKNQLDNAVQVTHAKINNSLVIGGYQP